VPFAGLCVFTWQQFECLPIPVTTRSKVRVCGRLLARIVGLNPAGAWTSASCEFRVLSGRGSVSG
jgi:hypothetical protein